jgi:glycosyltransferase involved in cell wall biosynthesis
VVGSAVPGVTDVINPAQNGWLFHPGDDAALAETLTAVLAGGPAIESVVECARADAPARFSLALQLARYEALFAELLAHARA